MILYKLHKDVLNLVLQSETLILKAEVWKTFKEAMFAPQLRMSARKSKKHFYCYFYF